MHSIVLPKVVRGIEEHILKAIINSLRGKWVPGPTKKGGATGKNHISLNFLFHAPGFGANTSAR